jgi:hypothetical protein
VSGLTLCNSEQPGAVITASLTRQMPENPAQAKARRARIDQMIEQYRVAKQRRLMRLAMRLWRQAETDHQLVKLEAPPERVH